MREGRGSVLWVFDVAGRPHRAHSHGESAWIDIANDVVYEVVAVNQIRKMKHSCGSAGGTQGRWPPMNAHSYISSPRTSAARGPSGRKRDRAILSNDETFHDRRTNGR